MLYCVQVNYRNEEAHQKNLSALVTAEVGLRVLEIVEEADTLLGIDCVRLDELRDGDRRKQKILEQGKVLYRKQACSLGP